MSFKAAQKSVWNETNEQTNKNWNKRSKYWVWDGIGKRLIFRPTSIHILLGSQCSAIFSFYVVCELQTHSCPQKKSFQAFCGTLTVDDTWTHESGNNSTPLSVSALFRFLFCLGFYFSVFFRVLRAPLF